MDLGLIPTEELCDEIKNRSQLCVLAYTMHDEETKSEMVNCTSSGKDWLKEIGLAEALKSDIEYNFRPTKGEDGRPNK